MNRYRQHTLSGATAITTLTATSELFGDVVRFVATASGQQITNGGNISLRYGDWVSSGAGDWIELFCDGTNWVEDRRQADPQLAVPVSVEERSAVLAGGVSTSGRVIGIGANASLSASVTSVAAMQWAFYLPLSAWALAGKTLKLRITHAVTTGNTAPGTNLTARIYKAAHEPGTAGFLRISSGQGATTINSPAANSGDGTNPPAVASTDIDPVALGMADGFYCLVFTPAASTAAGSDLETHLRLSRFYV